MYIPSRAEGFALYRHGKSTILEISKPWQEAVDTLYYFLSREGEEAPEGFPGETLILPVTRAVCMSTSHIAFLEALGKGDAVKGVSGAGYVSSPAMRDRIERGSVRDVGYEAGINNEVLVDISPDVIFLYGVSGENSIVTGKIKELGQKFIYVGDYVENDPLGRAEWMVAMGEIMDVRDKAEELFGHIAAEYESVKKLLPADGYRPKVMLNAPWRDTWFVPGDRSYMVRFINDAGGDYVCRGDDSDRSRPLSTEAAYVYAVQADYWINPGDVTSMDELTAGNPAFASIPAVTGGNVYNNNGRSNPYGGSDFWESGAVRPHMVLKDLVSILHPEALSGYGLYYFRKIE